MTDTRIDADRATREKLWQAQRLVRECAVALNSTEFYKRAVTINNALNSLRLEIGEHEADSDYAEGRWKEFNSIEELLTHLNSDDHSL